MTAWRGDQCPARGAGLSHAARYSGRCVFCDEPLHAVPPMGVPASASEASTGRASYATIFDHLYVYTLTGRCARQGCSKMRDEHADFLIGGADTDCVVDHQSVQPWTQCSVCHVTVEPKLFSNGPATDEPSTARLWISARQMKKLQAVFDGWVGGYYKS